MTTHRRSSRTKSHTKRILPLLALALVACGTEGASSSTKAEPVAVRNLQALNVCAKDPYTMSLAAFTSPAGTDVYATLTAIDPAHCPVPNIFKFVSIDSRNLKFADVPVVNGTAVVHLTGAPAGTILSVGVQVKSPDETEHLIGTGLHVLTRPDLSVASVAAPASSFDGEAVSIDVNVSELAGDSGAAATIQLFDGATLLGQQAISVGAGGTATASFSASFARGTHNLSATISAANPAEYNTANNSASTSITAKLRPDLTASAVSAPAASFDGESIAVGVNVAELNGDTGASFTVSLFDGNTFLASQGSAIAAGGSQSLSFDIALARGAHTLTATIAGSSPAESNTANNEASASISVSYRPDLAALSVTGPASSLGGDVVELSVTAAELDGDTGAHATLTLTDGATVLGQADLDLAAGGSQTLSFFAALGAGAHTLTATLSAASPAESDLSNNSASGSITVAQRPDLTVSSLTAPAGMVASQAGTFQATIAELNGDTGATATVTLFDGANALGAQSVSIGAGGSASVSFSASLSAGGHTLTARISDASPSESSTANNEASASVEVNEFRITASPTASDFEGFGAQFNHHVYADLSAAEGVTEQNVLQMEAKVAALEPQLIRIFWNRNNYAIADRRESFHKTVALANATGQSINITIQSLSPIASYDSTVQQFATVLKQLIEVEGNTNIKFVTLQNEVSDTAITQAQYEAAWRAFDGYAISLGIKSHLKYMMGDLTQTNQRSWLQYIAANMADLVDAYTVHIYWDYWDTAKLQFRLTDVATIIQNELPASARRPVYVTEFGNRGLNTFNGQDVGQPGVWSDGTPMNKTNITAFQHAWFNVLSSKLGFSGTVKWDGYFAKYDNGTQYHYMIGSPAEGWPTHPVYHLTRLFTLAAKPGYSPVAVDGSSGSKLLAGFASSTGDISVVGLDTSGAQLNAASGSSVSYNIGGLEANQSYQLKIWNQSGNGQLTNQGQVTANASGTATLSIPLHAVFALSTCLRDGQGNCVECLAASQCPGADSQCQTRTCNAGVCGINYVAAGTAVADQDEGDCRENQCDGAGNTVNAVKNADLPFDGVQCTLDLCTAGVPSNPNAPADTACSQNGGAFCNGSGSCVACTQNSQCASNICSGNICQANLCFDGIKNGSETDVDCGGSCAACANAKMCSVDADCSSANCVNGLCWTNQLVLSEIQTHGNNAAAPLGDEFIELYNPTDLPIVVDSTYQISSRGAAGGATNVCPTATANPIAVRWTGPAGGVSIPSHGHYLIAFSNYNGAVLKDANYVSAGNAADSGSVVLERTSGALVDSVCFFYDVKTEWNIRNCPALFTCQNSFVSNLPHTNVATAGNTDTSFERKPVGAAAGDGIDTNDTSDWTNGAASTPQNLASAPTP